VGSTKKCKTPATCVVGAIVNFIRFHTHQNKRRNVISLTHTSIMITFITIRIITSRHDFQSSTIYEYPPLPLHSFSPHSPPILLACKKANHGNNVTRRRNRQTQKSSDIDLMRRVSRSSTYKTHRHCEILRLLHYHEDIEF
jgi:hypothetical protein